MGFVTFSYELAPLMLTNDDRSLFSVVLKDPDDASEDCRRRAGRHHLAGAQAGDPLPSVMRTVVRRSRLVARLLCQEQRRPARATDGDLVAAIGLALTGIICGLFGYVASTICGSAAKSRSHRFRAAVDRLIDELNHRVKNILAVIQSIVTRTLRHGSDMDVSRDLLIGRIHAMSNVVTLLSGSQWQGVKLKGLFELRVSPIPTAWWSTDRISR